MTIARLLSLWHREPSVTIGCGGLLLAYALLVRQRSARQAGCFVVGVLLLLWALIGPLDVLGDTYLFSAHMLQHLVLVLLVPPLLVVGLPPSVSAGWRRWPVVAGIEARLGLPLVAWSIHIVTMWIWHLPVLYDATLHNEGLHIVEHLMFLVTAVIFWWPVLSGSGQLAARPLLGVAYLFGAAIASSLLGIIITFAAPGLYPSYLHPRDGLHILLWLRGGLGLIPAVDQQVAGITMWVGGGLVYLVAMMATLAKWYDDPRLAMPNRMVVQD